MLGPQSWKQQSRVSWEQSRGGESLPSTCFFMHTSFAAAQDEFGFLGCEFTLLDHVELLIQQQPQVLLLRATLNPFFAWSILVFGIAPCTWPCLPSWGPHGSSSQICQIPSGWHPIPLTLSWKIMCAQLNYLLPVSKGLLFHTYN